MLRNEGIFALSPLSSLLTLLDHHDSVINIGIDSLHNGLQKCVSDFLKIALFSFIPL